jgi:hypothetical protein
MRVNFLHVYSFDLEFPFPTQRGRSTKEGAKLGMDLIPEAPNAFANTWATGAETP